MVICGLQSTVAVFCLVRIVNRFLPLTLNPESYFLGKDTDLPLLPNALMLLIFSGSFNWGRLILLGHETNSWPYNHLRDRQCMSRLSQTTVELYLCWILSTLEEISNHRVPPRQRRAAEEFMPISNGLIFNYHLWEICVGNWLSMLRGNQAFTQGSMFYSSILGLLVWVPCRNELAYSESTALCFHMHFIILNKYLLLPVTSKELMQAGEIHFVPVVTWIRVQLVGQNVEIAWNVAWKS